MPTGRYNPSWEATGICQLPGLKTLAAQRALEQVTETQTDSGAAAMQETLLFILSDDEIHVYVRNTCMLL